MKKYIIFVGCLVVILSAGYSQKKIGIKEYHSTTTYRHFNYKYVQLDSETILFDPWDTIFEQQIVVDDLGFLVDESKYYNCKVKRIDEFIEGYGILVTTKIYGLQVHCYVVTNKANQFGAKNIRKGRIYKLKLVKYFDKPLIRTIDRKIPYHVLIDTNTLSILATGGFSYIFISPSLVGLSYINSQIVDSLELIKKQKIIELKPFICDFLTSVSMFDDTTVKLLNHIDTTLLKGVMSRFKLSGGYTSFYKLSERPPIETGLFDLSYSCLDTSSFENTLRCFFKNYFSYTSYKTKPNDRIPNCANIEIKYLYYLNDIHTVSIEWDVPTFKISFTMELTIKVIQGTPIIIGVNLYNIYNKHMLP